MTWMNESEVEETTYRLNTSETPNLFKGAKAVESLMRWTNQNSDGWHSWVKPGNASSRLMGVLEDAKTEQRNTGKATDISAAELRKLLTPIKSFLTRQGVQHAVVIREVIPYDA